MPHLIIEYVPQALSNGGAQALVDAAHQAARDSGLFDTSHIRTRAHAVSDYRCGEDDRPFVHAQLRIKPGRDRQARASLSEAVLTALRGQVSAPVVITVEVVELAADSYAKAQLG